MLIDDPNRKLLSVDLLLTYRCTSECSHCYVSSEVLPIVKTKNRVVYGV